MKESPAIFSADTGKINKDGRYTAPPDTHAGATITARVGDLTGTARVRSMPPLPWHFDFEDIAIGPDPRGGLPRGEPPLPWIGMRYRNVVRTVDGSNCMVKVTTIPKGTRSQGWIGPTDLHDYAISADLRAEESSRGTAESAGESDADAFAKASTSAAASLETSRLPDMGLIAQRYTLDLMGASQQLQVRSWPPQVATHFSKTVPFAWQAGVWYRMKFEASTRGDAAVLRGKVWPRSEPEPESWTVDAVHERGNLQGSPGFFGNSKVSEIYVDNVLVEELP